MITPFNLRAKVADNFNNNSYDLHWVKIKRHEKINNDCCSLIFIFLWL